MTLQPHVLLHPRNLPAKLARVAPEVPGLAYYTALAEKPTRQGNLPRPTCQDAVRQPKRWTSCMAITAHKTDRPFALFLPELCANPLGS